MKTQTVLILAGAAGAALIAAYAKDKLPAALARGLDAINPLNSENVFYTGVNSMGASVTGDSSWNLGARLYEALNPGAVAAERAALAPALPWSVTDSEDAELGASMDLWRAQSGPALAWRSPRGAL